MKNQNAFRLTFIAVLGIVPMLAFAEDRSRKSDRITREWKDGNVTVPCQIYLPLNYDKAKKYPLVLCMHGAGQMNRAPYTANMAASTALLNPQMREKYPAFLIVPQTTTGWVKRPGRREDIAAVGAQPECAALKLVMQGLADLMKEYSIDADRLYVSGQSMGGIASWSLVLHHPEIFAAAVPICGVGDPSQAAKIHCPVWVFHGAKDSTVPVSCSRDMVDAMKKAGLEVKYTEYPEGGHSVWDQAWNEKELAPWLFSQQRKKQ